MSESSVTVILFAILQGTLVMLWFFLKEKFRAINTLVDKLNEHERRISLLESSRYNDNGRRAHA